MKSIAMAVILLGAAGFALARQVPSNAALPRAMPSGPAAHAVKPSAEPDEAELTAAASGCSKMLREIAEFTPLPDRAGPGECGAIDRVQLDAIKMPDGSRVAMEPPATLRCAMAESVAEWVRSDLGSAAKDQGSALKAVVAGSYDCRPRNGVKGAKISEHGRSNALDVAALKLASGAVIDLTRRTDSREFRDKARASACSRFTTVLGPGADARHENHIHVDLAARSRGHRLCQWEVREPTELASANPAATAPPVPRTISAARASPSLLQAPRPAEAGAQAHSEPESAVPLPLRRPFEQVFAGRAQRYR